ncbi:hypothetical protein GCM10007111_25220 [Virgibacillus kapii]|uniref:BON domain-containing protein n=2 Tax=Virgibacillus kapii TaxID=1638645 RepID=A0ABQ2DPD7_9BACI|nr:hypothetical protein GCM10007111_25220 [Virgibacillus kapii]
MDKLTRIENKLDRILNLLGEKDSIDVSIQQPKVSMWGKVNPQEAKERIKKKSEIFADTIVGELSSTPDKAEVEKKIHENIKGLTRREAMDLLGKVRGKVVGNAPIDLGLEEVL